MSRIAMQLVAWLLVGSSCTTALAAEAAARRITVSGEGIVRISAADLTSWGLSTQDGIYLYTDGQAVNFATDNGSIQFYSAPYQNLFARDRAFLIANQALAYAGSSGEIAQAQQGAGAGDLAAYTEVCHVEENQYYASGLGGATPGEEHWYYSTLLIPGRKLQLTATLGGPLAAGPVRLVVALRGATDAIGGGVNHSIAVSCNGVRLGEVVWGGLLRKEVSFDLPAGLALEGANLVELLSQSLPGISTNTVCVDWIEVFYPRALTARADRLNFGATVAAGQKVAATGFTGEDVVGFDVTDPSRPVRLPLRVQQADATWSVDWNSAAEGARRFVLAGPTGRLALASNRSSAPWTCRQPIDCNYLVVTHEDYLEQANRLAGLHAAQGFKTTVYPATAVYDAFGCGQPQPEAIRSLAQFVKPKYLCLFGDATADPKGFLGAVTVGVLPSFFAQGSFFEEPSDNLMGCIDNDDIYPDIAVGRLPARSAAEAQAMVDKVAVRMAHSSSDQPDIRAALVLSDNAMPIFTTVADEVSAQYARWGSVERVPFAQYADAAAIRAAVIAGWAKKPRYFVYVGHAASTTLGNNQCIRTADVPSLVTDGELPAGVILACLAGFFNFSNGADSLAERMIKEPAKGVCAVVAPGGMSPPEGQQILGREIATAIADGRATSLGRALMLAKRRLPLGHADVLNSFNLLGDPALDALSLDDDGWNKVAPTITAQPAGQTVNVGQTATFTVAAEGTAPLAFQWKRNGANILGATASSYTTPATVAADDGAVFAVAVSNAYGGVVSSNAVLTVRVPPYIVTQPSSRTVSPGQSATFTVAAAGTAPLAYQWSKNGVDILGATASVYTTPTTSCADSGSFFGVTVSNVAGMVVSDSALLTIADNDSPARDFGGDGKADILWRETATGKTVVWSMDGATRTSSSYTSAQASTAWAEV
jgi:hypothetical protein